MTRARKAVPPLPSEVECELLAARAVGIAARLRPAVGDLAEPLAHAWDFVAEVDVALTGADDETYVSLLASTGARLLLDIIEELRLLLADHR